MTAHRSKPTLTPERVAWFARYYEANPSWGLFHVVLADGNSRVPIELDGLTGEELEAAIWFNALSPSQRVRLGQKARTRSYAPRQVAQT